jgi:hypothetical protein
MTIENSNTIKLSLGKIDITSNARSILTSDEVASALSRHARGDWGDVAPEDAERNIEAVHEGSQVYSAYGEVNRRFWVITAGDQSSTTVMMAKDDRESH